MSAVKRGCALSSTQRSLTLNPELLLRDPEALRALPRCLFQVFQVYNIQGIDPGPVHAFILKLIVRQLKQCYSAICQTDVVHDTASIEALCQPLEVLLPLTQFLFTAGPDGLKPHKELLLLEIGLQDFLNRILAGAEHAYPDVFLCLLRCLINTNNSIMGFRIATAMLPQVMKCPQIFASENHSLAYTKLMIGTRERAILTSLFLGDWYFTHNTWTSYWVRIVAEYSQVLKEVESRVLMSENPHTIDVAKRMFLDTLSHYIPSEDAILDVVRSDFSGNHEHTIPAYVAIFLSDRDRSSPAIFLFLIWFEVYREVRAAAYELSPFTEEHCDNVLCRLSDLYTEDFYELFELLNCVSAEDAAAAFVACLQTLPIGQPITAERMIEFKQELCGKLYSLRPLPIALCAAFEAFSTAVSIDEPPPSAPSADLAVSQQAIQVAPADANLVFHQLNYSAL